MKERAHTPIDRGLFAAIAACVVVELKLLPNYFYHPDFSSFGITSTLAWVASFALCLGVAYRRAGKSRLRKPQPLSSHDFWWLALATAIGVTVRLMLLHSRGIFSDEGFSIRSALQILHGAQLTPFSFIGDQPSNLAAWPIALMIPLTSDFRWAARLPSFFYSLGTAWFVFHTLWHFFNRRAALIGAVLVLFSIWDIHMQRLAEFSLSAIVVLVSATTYFLYGALFDGRPRRLAALGLCLALCFTTLYVPAVMLLPAGAAWLLQLVEPENRRDWWRRTAWIAGPFLVGITPTLIKIYTFPELCFGRHRAMMAGGVPQTIGTRAFFYLGQARALWQDFWSAASAFPGSFLWGIALDRLAWVLCFGGLIYAWYRVRDRRMQPLLLGLSAFSAMMIFPNRLISVWRELGLMVWLFLIAAIATSDWIGSLKRRRQEMALTLVLIGLVLSASSKLSAYWNFSSPSERWLISVGQITGILQPYRQAGYQLRVPPDQVFLSLELDFPPGTDLVAWKDPAQEIGALAPGEKVVFVNVTPGQYLTDLDKVAAATAAPHELRHLVGKQETAIGTLLVVPPLQAGAGEARQLGSLPQVKPAH